jgi:pseudo-rSAM protein
MNKPAENGYWFYIEGYVHLTLKGNNILLYNPLSGKIIEFGGVPEITRLIKRILIPRNMYTIRLTDSDLNKDGVRGFVQSVRDNFLGDLIPVSLSKRKPIQAPPIMKIQQDIDLLKKDKQRTPGEDIMAYLSRIWLYIDDTCARECSICGDAYLQFPFCTANRKRNHELDIADIQTIFRDAQSCPNLETHILGGDIFSYSQLPRLLELISGLPSVFLYIHYLNAIDNQDMIRSLPTNNVSLKIPVSFPLDDEKADKIIRFLDGLGTRFNLIFAIRGIEDFESANALLQRYPGVSADYHPFYDGFNLDFFADNLFVQREEIEAIRPSLKEIHARGVVNPNFFGNLFIRSDGRVYAGINASSLGKIGDLSLYDILIKELTSGKSWRSVRGNVMPCKACVYERLCPPISNYNMALGRYDLCRIDTNNSKNKQIKKEET